MTLRTIAELLDRLNTVANAANIEVHKPFLMTISAFSNTRGLGGGYLLFGVAHNAERGFYPQGVAGPDDLVSLIEDHCIDSFNVRVVPTIIQDKLNGVPLVAAFIPEALDAQKPVYILTQGMQNGSYRRMNGADKVYEKSDFQSSARDRPPARKRPRKPKPPHLLLRYRQKGSQAKSRSPRFELRVLPDATFDDLDEELLLTYKAAFIRENPTTGLLKVNMTTLLQVQGFASRVAKTIHPNVAGLLLFGKSEAIERLLPQASFVVGDGPRRFAPVMRSFTEMFAAMGAAAPPGAHLSAARELLVHALVRRDYEHDKPLSITCDHTALVIRTPCSPSKADVHNRLIGEVLAMFHTASANSSAYFGMLSASSMTLVSALREADLGPVTFEETGPSDSPGSNIPNLVTTLRWESHADTREAERVEQLARAQAARARELTPEQVKAAQAEAERKSLYHWRLRAKQAEEAAEAARQLVVDKLVQRTAALHAYLGPFAQDALEDADGVTLEVTLEEQFGLMQPHAVETFQHMIVALCDGYWRVATDLAAIFETSAAHVAEHLESLTQSERLVRSDPLGTEPPAYRKA